MHFVVLFTVLEDHMSSSKKKNKNNNKVNYTFLSSNQKQLCAINLKYAIFIFI